MSMFALQLNDTSQVILCLATTLLAAFAVSRLTKLAHLPNVTGYILAGIFIGPYCLGLVDSEMIRSMGFITDIALAFIAFGTGRYFKWSSLRRSGVRIFVLTAMESLVAGALVVLVMRGAFHLPLSFSLLLGAIASATAPASTLMTIRQYKAKGHFVTTLLQVVALDDAVSLLAFSVCAAIAQMSESATGSMAATVALPIAYNVLAIGLGVGLALLLKVLLRRVHSAYNRLLLVVIMLLEIAGVCSAVDISPLLSCMVFGAVHANVSKGETLFKKVDRFTPPILTVFFVVSGMRLEVPALASAGVMKSGAKHYAKQQKLLGELNGCIEEMYNGQELVSVFNYTDRAKARFEELNGALQKSAESAETASGKVTPITDLVNNLGYALSALLGCLSALRGGMLIGDVQAMLQYTKQFSQPFTSIAGMAGSFGAACAAAERIFALLDAEEETPDPEPAVVPTERGGAVEFRHVAFGYTPERQLMHDVNISVKPGQKVAIVGPTGAGKTTLINLLMRFYDVDSGAIFVDGVDTRSMTRHELRDRFGMVLQDAWLLEGSVRENIGYAEDDMPEGKIVAAAKNASVDAFIRTLPGGYDFVLDSGAENVSQGQRQLLTIARAMASDPEIMILDEATSNVDTHTEQLIQNAMNRLMRGRTSFVIAHRLSTIRDADMILYMENGDILEQGTHEELLARSGKYAALYMSQFA